MSAVLDPASLLVAAAGVIVLGVGAAVRQWRQGLAVMLDLFVAAGLLRLAHDPGWDRIVAAAAIVAIRHLVVFGLRQPSGPPGPTSALLRAGPHQAGR